MKVDKEVGGRRKWRNAGETANDKLNKKKKLRQNSQMMNVWSKEILDMVVLERAIMLLLCILVRRFSPSSREWTRGIHDLLDTRPSSLFKLLRRCWISTASFMIQSMYWAVVEILLPWGCIKSFPSKVCSTTANYLAPVRKVPKANSLQSCPRRP